MSKRRMNNKGMTLVEIVIVLLIASIAMTITGGILINSLGYFQDTTELSTDKTTGDGVLDFIKSEIQYSTKVSVQKDIPSNDDWHCLYVQNDQLYKDSDPVFTKTNTKKGDYYGNRKLEIKTNCFNNGYRMDMEIYLNTGSGTNKETKYKVTHTFEFLNLKKDKNSGSTTTTVWNTDKGTLSTDYKLWYIKDASAITPDTDDGKKDDTDTDSTGDGTVADIINNIDPSNYVGVYETKTGGFLYEPGEIVWYDGDWWERVVKWNNEAPGEDFSWKRLNKNYTANFLEGENKKYSSYEKGDIVIYNGYYYQATEDIGGYSTESLWHTPGHAGWNTLGSVDDPAVVAIVKQNKYTPKKIYKCETVVNKYIQYFKNSNDLRDNTKKNYDEYDNLIDYKENDIVKVRSDAASDFYDLWIKKFNFGTGKGAPGTPQNGWVKISRYWSIDSSYVYGDMTFVGVKNINYVKAVQQISTVMDIINNQDYLYNHYGKWVDGKQVDIKKFYQHCDENGNEIWQSWEKR